MVNHRGMRRPGNVLVTKYSRLSRIRVRVDLTGSRSGAGRVVGGGESSVARGVGARSLGVRGQNPDRTYRTNGTYRSPELLYRSRWSHKSYPRFAAACRQFYRSFAV